MAEITLGGVALLWSDSPEAAAQTVFGKGISVCVTAMGMVALATAMLTLMVANRLSRSVLLTTTIAVILITACVGVLAIATLTADPGVGFLLCFGWGLTCPAGLNLCHTNGPSANQESTTRRTR